MHLSWGPSCPASQQEATRWEAKKQGTCCVLFGSKQPFWCGYSHVGFGSDPGTHLRELGPSRQDLIMSCESRPN